MKKASFIVLLAAAFAAGALAGGHGGLPVDAAAAETDAAPETAETTETDAAPETAEATETDAAPDKDSTAETDDAARTAVTKRTDPAPEEPEEEVLLEEAEEPAGSYVIRFHEDFDESNDRTFTQTIAFGETAAVAEPPWTHEGYRFAGWFASGYGINHALANVYAAGAPVLDLGLPDGSVIEFYAGWTEEEEQQTAENTD